MINNLQIKDIQQKLEALISSKSSDYNKGVQDCINILNQLNDL